MATEYKPAPDTGTEDVQSIDSDIVSLAQKYIFPIDRIRGYDSKDSVRPFESRCHAFYRYLGLPVVDPGADDSFYSPGYYPPSKSNTNATKGNTSRKNIDTKFKASPLKSISAIRENNFKLLRNVFAKQDTISSLYALALQEVRAFQVIDESENSDPFFADQQTYTVSSRKQALTDFLSVNSGQQVMVDTNNALNALGSGGPLGTYLDSGQHILKPFIVDPIIANSIQPPTNLICVPFLKTLADTKLNKNTPLLRPGIETIIRVRLANNPTDTLFLDDVRKIVSGEVSPGQSAAVLDRQGIIDTLEAVFQINDLSSLPDSFNTSLSNIQLTTITGLVKTLKSIIIQLHKCLHPIQLAALNINWFPTPSVEGPEIIRGAGLNRFGVALTDIDKKITSLKLQILKSNSSTNASSLASLGNFATPFASFSPKAVSTMGTELETLQAQKKNYSDTALKAMSNMELISGEISGLGLVDILALYIALWSIEDKYLLGLIDNDSFERLYNYNKDLQGIPAVANRYNGTKPTIKDCLIKLEEKIINVLTFADTQLKWQILNPSDNQGGTIDS
jgi:hypothetical protein